MKIRAPIHRLEKEADRIDMRIKLDTDSLRALCKAGRSKGQEVGCLLRAVTLCRCEGGYEDVWDENCRYHILSHFGI